MVGGKWVESWGRAQKIVSLMDADFHGLRLGKRLGMQRDRTSLNRGEGSHCGQVVLCRE